MTQIAVVVLSGTPFAWEFCLTEDVLENARDNLQAQLVQHYPNVGFQWREEAERNIVKSASSDRLSDTIDDYMTINEADCLRRALGGAALSPEPPNTKAGVATVGLSNRLFPWRYCIKLAVTSRAIALLRGRMTTHFSDVRFTWIGGGNHSVKSATSAKLSAEIDGYITDVAPLCLRDAYIDVADCFTPYSGWWSEYEDVLNAFPGNYSSGAYSTWLEEVAGVLLRNPNRKEDDNA